MKFHALILLIIICICANIKCMDSTNSIIKAIEPLSQLQFRDLPLEILDYIATFLVFPNKETDAEFERRLRILEKENHLDEKLTPMGKVFYWSNIKSPGYYLEQKNGKISCLLKPIYLPCISAYSSNNKHLIVASKNNNNKTEVMVCDIRKKKINRTYEFTGEAKNCAIADEGDCYALIWNEDKGTVINFYDLPYHGYKRIFSKDKFNVASIGFNKQFTKFGYVTEQSRFFSIDILPTFISKPIRKTLSKYFRLRGVCKNFPYYVEKKPSFFAVKNYNRTLSNFY